METQLLDLMITKIEVLNLDITMVQRLRLVSSVLMIVQASLHLLQMPVTLLKYLVVVQVMLLLVILRQLETLQ